MAANDVALNLLVNTEKAIGNIEKFGKTVSTVATASVALLGAKVIADGINNIVNGIRNVADAASKQQVAVRGLNNALSLAGDYSDAASKRMQDFAKSMQSSTGIADEVILQQLSIAKSFGASNEQATRLIDAALNLSAATGESLESAVKNLGKSLGGLTGELGETIPALKTMTIEQLKAGGAIQFVLERFGGAAADKMQDYEGAIAGVNVAQQSFLESVGNIIIKNPAVIAAIQSVSKMFDSLSKLVDDNSESMSGLVTQFVKLSASGVVPAVKSVLFFVRAGQGLIGITRLIIQGVEEATLSFFALTQQVLKIVNVAGIFDRQVATMTQAVLNQSESLNEGYDSMAKMTDGFETFNGITDIAIDEIDKLVDGIQKIGDTQEKSTDKALTALGKYKDEVATLNNSDLLQGTRLNKVRETDEELLKEQKTLKGRTELFVEDMISGLKSKMEANRSFIEDAFNFANLAMSGEDGARKFLGSISGAIADYFLPGIGKVVGPFVEALSQGPEKVGQMVTEFADAMPELIDNIAEALPVLIEKLAEKADVIITALVEATPKITAALIKASPQIAAALIESIAELFKRFIEGFIFNFEPITEGIKKVFGEIWEGLKQFVTDILTVPQKFVEFFASFFSDLFSGIGKAIQSIFDGISLHEFFNQITDSGREFFNKIIEAAEEFVNKLDPFGGNGDRNTNTGGFEETIGVDIPGVKLAKGGEIPSGFPNDTFPASLTSRELVIPPGDTERLSRFLDRQEQRRETEPNRDDEVVALLMEIRNRLGSMPTVQTVLKVGERELGEAIFRLSRQNSRLFA